MKTIIYFSLTVVLVLSSCVTLFDNRHKGNGNVTVEERQVSPFDKIEINGVFNVHLAQGDTENVEVEIDQNLQQYVIVACKGTTLYIDTEKGVNFGKTTKNNIYVSLIGIDCIKVGGVCNVKNSSSLCSNELNIVVDGVSNISLGLNCNLLDVKIDGVGNVELFGDAQEFTVKKDGVGNLKAENLRADVARINNSGVGSAHIYASRELYLRNSGVGSIRYSGDAVIKSLESSGTGKITKN